MAYLRCLMFNKNDSGIGERARMMRERKGWSQQQLAAKVPGVKQQSIDQLEQGKVRRPRFLPELAEALGVREEWLRTGEGRMARPQPEDDRDGNPDLVRDIVLGVDKALKRLGIAMSEDDRADVIGRLFELATSKDGAARADLAEAADIIVRYERLRRQEQK